MEDKEVKTGGIYRHWRGDFYKVVLISYDEVTGKPLVSYYRCNESGIFQSIRIEPKLDEEEIVNQPFTRHLSIFVQRFTFVKMTRNA